MHACVRVCFLRPFSQMFQFKICVSLFLTACMCVCLWVCFDTQKTANLSLRILFTLAISFASILFCFVIVVTAWLSFIIQSCSIKLFLLWFSNRIHCEYMEQGKHTPKMYFEKPHTSHTELNDLSYSSTRAQHSRNTELMMIWHSQRHYRIELNWQESESREMRRKKLTKTPPTTIATVQTTPYVRMNN